MLGLVIKFNLIIFNNHFSKVCNTKKTEGSDRKKIVSSGFMPLLLLLFSFNLTLI